LTVACVIPTYNRRELVMRAVLSALEQTRPPDEVVVVDDGSTDGTSDALLEAFGKQVRVIVQENAGVSAARNKGIQESVSTFVAFLDSDDYWLPNKLEAQLPLMSDHRTVLSATRFAFDHDVEGLEAIDLTSVESIRWDNPLHWLSRPGGHGMLLQTSIVRRSFLLEAGLFDTSFRVAEDTELFYRLARLGPFVEWPVPLTVFNRNEPENRLSATSDPKYRRDVIMYNLSIYEKVLPLVPRDDRLSKRNISRLLAFYLRRRAEVAVADGYFTRARLDAVRSVSLGCADWRVLIAALVLICYPRFRVGELRGRYAIDCEDLGAKHTLTESEDL